MRAARRALQSKKVGHGGTLDPAATGLLVLAAGSATRLLQFVEKQEKVYRTIFIFGKRSATHDLECEELETVPAAPFSRKAVEAVLPSFCGEIQQRPPRFSAKKIAGNKACTLARKGLDFHLPACQVLCKRIEIVRFDFPKIELRLECGPGFFVRALCRDLAEKLGTAAVCAEIFRERIGRFKVESAVSLSQISLENLLPPRPEFFNFPAVQISDDQLPAIKRGQKIFLPALFNSGQKLAAAFLEKELVAVGEIAGDFFQPRKVLA